MSDHGRLIPLSTTLNVFVFRVYRTYYICIRLFPNAFIKTNPLRLIPINFDSNLDSNCLLFDNIGIRRIREGKRRKEKRTCKKNGAIEKHDTIYSRTRISTRSNVCILIFFLRGSTARRQFAYVADWKGRALFQLLAEGRIAERKGGDCATMCIYIYIFVRLNWTRTRSCGEI